MCIGCHNKIEETSDSPKVRCGKCRMAQKKKPAFSTLLLFPKVISLVCCPQITSLIVPEVSGSFTETNFIFFPDRVVKSKSRIVIIHRSYIHL
jgi:hypothetical protein